MAFISVLFYLYSVDNAVIIKQEAKVCRANIYCYLFKQPRFIALLNVERVFYVFFISPKKVYYLYEYCT